MPCSKQWEEVRENFSLGMEVGVPTSLGVEMEDAQPLGVTERERRGHKAKERGTGFWFSKS